MLAAERKVYSHAHEGAFEYDHSPKHRKKRKRNTKLKVVFLIALGFIMGLTIIFRYAYIVESKYQLESMKKELAKIEETNQSLKIQLSKLKSLDRIESVARTELGMIEPNLDSIIFIKSPDFSLAMQNERKQEKTTREADYGALSVMNKINAIMNIFN